MAQALPGDSLKIKIAEEFLKKKLGEKVVRDKLAFAGIYESSLDLVTFELKGRTENRKNLVVVFLDGEKVESKYNTKITKKDISNFFEGKPTKNLFWNKEYATNIAKRLDFDKGIKGWEIQLEGLVYDISWGIYSYVAETWDPYEAGGKALKVDAKTGKYEIQDWSEIE
ncbi:hypothetical protein H7F15_19275 [Pontibacter sp. Tf4]|uniref:hypothetical protein n=1 Tax=Pontibacter sp. Tf4 TaxID=2761620 RepID=UPI00162682D6|nr:hypothetical protein [Pontibacter sp. Tf4]MBB6613185.1 hypothetical protein [Pontibacter sp. Tf4]